VTRCTFASRARGTCQVYVTLLPTTWCTAHPALALALSLALP
jgi:hypothetical protein